MSNGILPGFLPVGPLEEEDGRAVLLEVGSIEEGSEEGSSDDCLTRSNCHSRPNET